MIWFNGIELDYNKGILDKLVIKKALTDVESLSDRKGTSSTKFSVPRTANNEAAFGFVSADGSVANTFGTAIIYLDGNLYSEGSIYIMGIDDKNFKCNFYGADIDFISTIKELPLSDLIVEDEATTFANSYITYTDAVFTGKLAAIDTSSSLEYTMLQPQALLENLGQVAGDLTIVNLAPAFLLSNTIETIITNQGLTLVSNALADDYFDNLIYSTYKGEHLSANLFLSASNTVTTLEETISLGTKSLGSGVTKTVNKYTIGRQVDKLRVRFNCDYTPDAKVNTSKLIVKLYNSSNNIYWTTNEYQLLEGNNAIEFEYAPSFSLPTNSYIQVFIRTTLNPSEVLPISTTIDISDAKISIDTILASDICLLRDYFSDMTQLDFLANTLKHFNMVMDIVEDVVYIELQDREFIPLSENTIDGLASEQVDISDKITNIKDISFEYKKTNKVYFKQNAEENTLITPDRKLTKTNDFGSILKTFNSYDTKQAAENYETDFSTMPNVYDIEGALGVSNSDIELNLTWTNFITVMYNDRWTFGTTGFKSIDNVLYYVDMTVTGALYDTYIYSNDFIRFDYIVQYLFNALLEQKQNNRIREIELYDKTGTLINFRKDYIINDQLYKLIEYEFEPVSKKVKAKIIMK